jgi:hypothetical protein
MQLEAAPQAPKPIAWAPRVPSNAHIDGGEKGAIVEQAGEEVTRS